MMGRRFQAVADGHGLKYASRASVVRAPRAQVVRSHGNEASERVRYSAQLGQLLQLQSAQGALYGVSRVFNGMVNAFMLVGILALGSTYVS